MSLKVGYFDTGAEKYQHEELALVNSIITKTGFVQNFEDGLEVVETTPATMAVKVKKGFFFFEGYWIYNDTELTLSVDAAHESQNRIDRVVIRLRPAEALMENRLKFAILKGDNFVGQPAPKSPTWSELEKEKVIYDIAINGGITSITNSYLTDRRYDQELCGVAAGLSSVKADELFSGKSSKLHGDAFGFTMSGSGNTFNHAVVGYDVNDKEWVYAFSHGTHTVTPKMYRFDPSVVAESSEEIMAELTTDENRRYPGVVSNGKTIYIAGGLKSISTYTTEPTNLFQSYSVEDDTYTNLANLPKALYYPRIVICNDQIYCFGGHDGSNYVTDAYKYNPSNNTWTTLASFSTAQTSTWIGIAVDEENEHIYMSYGTIFMRYDIAGNFYSSKNNIRWYDSNPANMVAWFNDEFIKAGLLLRPDGQVYSIEDDKLYKFDWLHPNNDYRVLKFKDGRFALIGIGSTGCKWKNSFFKMGEAPTSSLAAFRQSPDARFMLANFTTLSIGGASIGLKAGDAYGIFNDDETLNEDEYEFEVMG